MFVEAAGIRKNPIPFPFVLCLNSTIMSQLQALASPDQAAALQTFSSLLKETALRVSRCLNHDKSVSTNTKTKKVFRTQHKKGKPSDALELNLSGCVGIIQIGFIVTVVNGNAITTQSMVKLRSQEA